MRAVQDQPAVQRSTRAEAAEPVARAKIAVHLMAELVAVLSAAEAEPALGALPNELALIRTDLRRTSSCRPCHPAQHRRESENYP